MFRPVRAAAVLWATASAAMRRDGLVLCGAAFLMVWAGPSFAAPVAEGAPPRVAGDPHSDPEEVSDHTTYILFAEGSRSIDVSGSTGELGRARALRIGLEAMLYVRQGAAAYVIRDPETLRQARALFASEEAIGARQTELGSRQTALGERQTQLAEEQRRLSVVQSQASPSEAADSIREQRALGRQINALGKAEDSLGRGVSILGRAQNLSAEEGRVKFRDLHADAIGRGVARRVD